MSEYATCAACGDRVRNSYNGWTQHTEGAKHGLVMMGLTPAVADRIAQECADAGIAHEAAMAAVRYALNLPPSELARKATALHEFAAGLSERLPE